MILEKNKIYYMILLSKAYPSQIIVQQITIIQHYCPTAPIQRLLYLTTNKETNISKQETLTIWRHTQQEVNQVINKKNILSIANGWFIADSKMAAMKEIRKYYKENYFWYPKSIYATNSPHTLKTLYKTALYKIYNT